MATSEVPRKGILPQRVAMYDILYYHVGKWVAKVIMAMVPWAQISQIDAVALLVKYLALGLACTMPCHPKHNL